MEVISSFYIFIWVLLSFFVGMASSAKNIGFWGAFILSLVFSPVIGLIAGIISSKKKPKEVIIVDGAKSSTADELKKLNDLKKDGVITHAEFETQKEKILNG
ncbi:MAG: SHOCT domain-containing protein [Bacteroidota bacterium]